MTYKFFIANSGIIFSILGTILGTILGAILSDMQNKKNKINEINMEILKELIIMKKYYNNFISKKSDFEIYLEVDEFGPLEEVDLFKKNIELLKLFLKKRMQREINNLISEMDMGCSIACNYTLSNYNNFDDSVDESLNKESFQESVELYCTEMIKKIDKVILKIL